jgi:hypothetical protein
MKKKLIIAVVSLTTVVCSVSGMATAATKPVAKAATNCAPTTLPTATSNTTLNDYFAQQYGPGWVGGDATYSTKLPDGRQAWTFSDSLIGTANTDGTATFTGMPHNTELVGTGGQLTSNYGGTYSAPTSLIPSRSTNSWWWVGSTLVENNTQLIFVNDFDARNMFGYFTGNSGIAVMKLPTGGQPTYSKVQSLPTDSTTQWGGALASDSTYNYIYGLSSDSGNGTFYGMKVARVAKGKTLTTSAWQYWNGSSWVSGEWRAVTLATTNTITGVMQQPSWMGTGYVATSIPSGVFNDNVLQLSFACSPQGPWSTPQTVASIPEITQYHNEMAYIPTFHPELSNSTTGLSVSYNVNTTDGFGALAQNIHQYQPRFMQLR